MAVADAALQSTAPEEEEGVRAALEAAASDDVEFWGGP